MDKFDAIFAKHEGNDKVYMFEAPHYSGIKVGDKVIADTKSGKATAAVVAVNDLDFRYEADKRMFEMYKIITGATEPLKRVRAVIKQTDINYEDEEIGEDEE